MLTISFRFPAMAQLPRRISEHSANTVTGAKVRMPGMPSNNSMRLTVLRATADAEHSATYG